MASQVDRGWFFVMISAASEDGFQKMRKRRDTRHLILRSALRAAMADGLGADGLGTLIYLSLMSRSLKWLHITGPAAVNFLHHKT